MMKNFNEAIKILIALIKNKKHNGLCVIFWASVRAYQYMHVTNSAAHSDTIL